MENWIALNEYSSKYRVSVSTLRRKIKAIHVNFRLEDGKYYIIDKPISAHQRTHRPSQDSTSPLVSTSSPSLSLFNKEGVSSSSSDVASKPKVDSIKAPEKRASEKKEIEPTVLATQAEAKPKSILRVNKDEPILTAANRLLNELKKAYSQILQEKEEQIMQLKNEQADLKTLVRVLEGENQRLINLQKTSKKPSDS